MRDIETIDSELRSVAALRRAARARGGPRLSIAVADALLDDRRRRANSYHPTAILVSGISAGCVPSAAANHGPHNRRSLYTNPLATTDPQVVVESTLL